MKKRKKYRGEDEIMNEFKYIRGKTKNGLILVLNFILVIGIMASYRIFALDSNANLLGVNYGIVYADDFSSAQICFDLNKVDTKKFKIIDILDSNSAVLPLNKSVSTVKKNGYYIFTVRYKELDASDTQSSIKKLNMAVTVDKIKISDNKISDNEYKEENNNIQQNKNKKVLTKAADISSSDDKKRMATDLGNIFSADDMRVYIDATNWVPASKSTNVNPKIIGDQVILYSPISSGAIPTSPWRGDTWFLTKTEVPAKQKISLKSNWTLSYYAKTPSVTRGQGASGYVRIAPVNSSKYSSIEMNAYANGPANSSQLYIYDATNGNTTENVTKGSGYFTTEQRVVVSCRYDGKSNTIFSISAGGKTVSRTYVTSELGDNAEITLGGTMAWGYFQNNDQAHGNFPTGELYVRFDSLSYDNFNPVFENLKWFDKNGTEINDKSNSVIKPGDILTVKATVRNDVSVNDIIPVKLFSSDDESLAASKGIKFDTDLENGIPIELSNSQQEVTFKVTVKDTIGDISLGVRLEDDFFHTKQYRQVKTKVSVGQIFLKGFPQYSIVEPERDVNGKIIVDSSGNMIFSEKDVDQNRLNQDSYVRIVLGMKNPREKENLEMNITVDSQMASGLDFDNLYFESQSMIGADNEDVDVLKKVFKGQMPLKFTLLPAGEAQLVVVVPVKQTTEGAPFNKNDVQKLNFDVSGVLMPDGELQPAEGTWESETVVNNNPIVDIDRVLDTTNIVLKRQESFDLTSTNPSMLDFSLVDSSSGSSTAETSDVSIRNLGTVSDWKYFGLESVNDSSGTVPAYSDDGKQITVSVTYNKFIMINGKKHWTRLGTGANARFREKTGTVTLAVDGGVILPEAYIEIPRTLYLSDDRGIDEKHAGVMAKIAIVEGVETSHAFTVKADNNFRIENKIHQSYNVSLYDENKNQFESSSGADTTKVDIGTLDKDNREKKIWFNLLKNPDRAPDIYNGMMQFYITMSK